MIEINNPKELADFFIKAARDNAKALERLSRVITPGEPAQAVREPYRAPNPRADLLWLAVDLDGTLAEPIWTPDNPTSEIGAPIQRNVAKLRIAVDKGYKVIIHTARPWTDYENIEGWLNYHGIPFKAIQCGKILAALYIDDRGRYSEDESWLPKGK